MLSAAVRTTLPLIYGIGFLLGMAWVLFMISPNVLAQALYMVGKVVDAVSAWSGVVGLLLGVLARAKGAKNEQAGS